MTNPAYLTIFVLGGSIVMVATALFGLSRALTRANWSVGERVPVVRGTAIVVIGWFAAAVILAWSGVYEGGPDRFPTIQFGILPPIVIGSLLIWRSSTVSRIIEAVPQHWLVGVQVIRGLGAIFLILFAAGQLPGLFALPAGVGDVLVATLALVVARAYARNPEGSAGLLAAWNVLGIVDLVVAVGTGFATAPSLFQLAAFDNPNTLIAAFPLALVPVYLVPLWIVLHIASLTKLRRSTAGSTRAHDVSVASDTMAQVSGHRR